jgi:cyclopropane fatty-acyl-phospholipid synthase-like methyltransferase
MSSETVNYYNAKAEALSASYRAADAKQRQDILRRWLPQNGRLLEIGCGCGKEAAFAASLCCDVVATDASYGMLKEAEKTLAAENQSSKVKLIELAFPCQQSDPFLNQKFDAVLASAVIMHLPEHDFFEFAFQVKSLIKANGIFICSFCTERPPDPADSRLYILRQPAEVQLMFERLGFTVLTSDDSPDGLGREIKWTTIVFSLANDSGKKQVY